MSEGGVRVRERQSVEQERGGGAATAATAVRMSRNKAGVFRSFVDNQETKARVFVSYIIIKKRWAAVSWHFLIFKKRQTVVFRIPVSHERGTPCTRHSRNYNTLAQRSIGRCFPNSVLG